jgi:hypothetical protein
MSVTGETDPNKVLDQMTRLADTTQAQVLPPQGADNSFFQQTNTTQRIANNGFTL